LNNISQINITYNSRTYIENVHCKSVSSWPQSGIINIYDNSTGYIKFINFNGSFEDGATGGATGGASYYGLYASNNSIMILDEKIKIVNFKKTLLYANNSSTIKIIMKSTELVTRVKDIYLGSTGPADMANACKDLAIHINNDSTFFSECSLRNIYGSINITNNSTMNIYNLTYTYNNINTTYKGILVDNFSTLICNNLKATTNYTCVTISNNSTILCTVYMNIKFTGATGAQTGLYIKNMSKAIIGTIGQNSTDYEKNGLYIEFLTDIINSDYLLASTGIYL
jgi:hypothetical protein